MSYDTIQLFSFGTIIVLSDQTILSSENCDHLRSYDPFHGGRGEIAADANMQITMGHTTSAIQYSCSLHLQM